MDKFIFLPMCVLPKSLNRLLKCHNFNHRPVSVGWEEVLFEFFRSRVNDLLIVVCDAKGRLILYTYRWGKTKNVNLEYNIEKLLRHWSSLLFFFLSFPNHAFYVVALFQKINTEK